MRCVIITDAYPPATTSAAVQVRDLAVEFARQGHYISVLTPDPDIPSHLHIEQIDGVRVCRVRTQRIKNIGHLRRAWGEVLMPFTMFFKLTLSDQPQWHFDFIAWYSPSIFHGVLARLLCGSQKCKRYLILRDIFPEWAADVGLLSRGLPYQFFKTVALYQYSIADVIGVQAAGNLGYFENWAQRSGRRLEVLKNWLDQANHLRCRIRLDQSLLAGRKVFVHAGNVGIAQGVLSIINAAYLLQERMDIGFLFVGRGSEFENVKSYAESLNLSNILFFGEVPSDEISDLYSQCYAGIVSLDLRHKTHNIPGKFVSYLRSGLPVLANVNIGNELCELIDCERIGRAVSVDNPIQIADALVALVSDVDNDVEIRIRCANVFQRDFSVERAVKQIVDAVRI